jgi:hypothetical protein
MAFPLFRFFGEDVAAVTLGTFKVATGSAFKPFRSTTIGFHFRHIIKILRIIDVAEK